MAGVNNEIFNWTWDRICIRCSGFLFLVKNLTSKYGQRHFDTTKKSATIVVKTGSKTATQKTAEAIGDLVGNKIVEKTTKTASTLDDPDESAQPTEMPKEIYIPSGKWQQIIDKLSSI